MKKQTVFVGLSGGVDSSVSAALLLEQGYHVVGVFIKVWHPEFMVCHWEAERLDAMRVAAHLGIPFRTCDAEVAYRDAVANYFISSYQNGLTPNPDVLCNKEVKFGVFLDYARAEGADFVATGHYAQVTHDTNGSHLWRGTDTEKDQSYFLWTLSPAQLAHTLFPVGHIPKTTVRALAQKFKLPTATKRDSQGICFLGHIDIPEFLSHYINLTPGMVVTEEGTVIGTHRGTLVYTIGQRHGFTITHKSYAGKIFYVRKKDIETNTLIVGTTPPLTENGNTITLSDTILRTTIKPTDVLTAQTRYRQMPFAVSLSMQTDTTIKIIPHEQIELPAIGQSCVLYRGDECIGGGIINQCQH